MVEIGSTVELKHANCSVLVQSEPLPWSLITCRSLSWDLQESVKRAKATKPWTYPHENSPLVFLTPHIFLIALKQCNHLPVPWCFDTWVLQEPGRKAILDFNVLSSKMCSAIFTSCSKLSCVSCPSTKQELSDLIRLQRRKKKKRLGKVSDAQFELTLLCLNLMFWKVF